MVKRYSRNTQISRYASRSPRHRTRRKSSSWLWLFSGILIGLVIPGIIYIKHSSLPNKAAEEEQKIVSTQSTSPKKVSKKHPLAEAKKHCSKPGLASAHAHYDFYDLLASQGCDETTAEKPLPAPHKQFQLEIAIFQSFTDADEMKAELALGGFDNINIVKTIQDDETIYKVLAGPFDSKEAALKAQKQLKETHNVAGTVVSLEK